MRWGAFRFMKRQGGDGKSPALNVEAAAPATPDLGLEQARKDYEWGVSERSRAAAWVEWYRRRDAAVAALKLALPPALFKIERQLDNTYVTKVWSAKVSRLPRDAFDHTDYALVEAAKSSRLYRHYSSSDPVAVFMQKAVGVDHGWPDASRDLYYTEHWEKMNDLIFSGLREAEQWLDDYLNPKGREWGYDAYGVKVSAEGEPTPVHPVESHFQPPEDPEWIRHDARYLVAQPRTLRTLLMDDYD